MPHVYEWVVMHSGQTLALLLRAHCERQSPADSVAMQILQSLPTRLCLQHTATHCNTLQHIATHWMPWLCRLCIAGTLWSCYCEHTPQKMLSLDTGVCGWCSVLQRVAACCSMLQCVERVEPLTCPHSFVCDMTHQSYSRSATRFITTSSYVTWPINTPLWMPHDSCICDMIHDAAHTHVVTWLIPDSGAGGYDMVCVRVHVCMCGGGGYVIWFVHYERTHLCVVTWLISCDVTHSYVATWLNHVSWRDSQLTWGPESDVVKISYSCTVTPLVHVQWYQPFRCVDVTHSMDLTHFIDVYICVYVFIHINIYIYPLPLHTITNICIYLYV